VLEEEKGDLVRVGGVRAMAEGNKGGLGALSDAGSCVSSTTVSVVVHKNGKSLRIEMSNYGPVRVPGRGGRKTARFKYVRSTFDVALATWEESQQSDVQTVAPLSPSWKDCRGCE
jgi:hypothetical protein